jgi:enediyne biosynthesis protein E4
MTLEEVKKAMQDRRHGAAARQLTAMLDRRPDWDEAAYFLGVCEQARGRIDAASAAFGRNAGGTRG